jgi:CrcB protein
MSWTTLGLAVFGAMGVLARHGVQRLVPRPGQLPWGTFVVNVSGSLLLGFLLTIVARRYAMPMWIQEISFVGFLGGYTTFSALSLETFLMLEHRQYGIALAYSLGSVVAGVGGVLAGTWLGRLVT